MLHLAATASEIPPPLLVVGWNVLMESGEWPIALRETESTSDERNFHLNRSICWPEFLLTCISLRIIQNINIVNPSSFWRTQVLNRDLTQHSKLRPDAHPS